MRSVYLSYPIDQASTSRASLFQWVDQSKGWLLDVGVGSVFDPGDAFLVAGPANDSVARINEAAQNACDGVLAFLPRGVPTIGVPMEIQRALTTNQPVAVVTDTNSWSLAGVPTFPETDEGVRAAVAMLAGAKPAEPARDALPFIVGPGGVLPTKAYKDDAGFDLYASQDLALTIGKATDVPTGVSVELPPFAWGLIIGRSSTRRLRNIVVHPGVIDTGWRGELLINAEYVGPNTQMHIDKGERIAQLIVMYNPSRTMEAVQVGALTPHARGQNGFGSSGW